MLCPFHLAVPVHDLTAARAFYSGLLGCVEGRSAADWVDFDFFGHQLVCHRSVVDSLPAAERNSVDGEQVPVPHFGVVLDRATWQQLATRLQAAELEFIIPPGVRFAGTAGEQSTFFLLDPSGNALEFKAMHKDGSLFRR